MIVNCLKQVKAKKSCMLYVVFIKFRTKTQPPDSYKIVFMLHNDLLDAEPYDEFSRQNNW